MRIDSLKRYYISYNLYIFSQGLVGVFLNILFFSTGSYAELLYFQFLSAIGLSIAFALCGYAMRRYGTAILFSYGEISRALLLMSIVLGAQFTSNIYVLGVLYGLSGGIFWSGNNSMMYDITNKANRMSFISINNIIGGVAAFIAPSIAGVLIQLTPLSGALRFSGDFTVAALLLIASSLLVRGIAPMENSGSAYRIRDGMVDGARNYKAFKIYFLTSQLFIIPFTVLVPVYVFYITGSYFITGVFASFTISIGVLANYFSKGIRNWERFVKVAVAGVVLSSLIFVLPELFGSTLSLFLFSGAYTLFSVPLANKAYSSFFDVIDNNVGIDRSSFMINREYYLTAGRTAAIALFLAGTYYLNADLALDIIIPATSLYSISYLYTSSPRKPRLTIFKSVFSRG